MNIPKLLYVGLVIRSLSEGSETVGFIIDADKQHTKEFEKRKASVDKWRRPSGTYQKDGGFKFIENKPQTGFKIVTNVRRYTTKNVVWRVAHPEGFEFEISSENFCDLIETNTIINGEFQEQMFFTKNRQLISKNTKLYTEALKEEKTKSNIKTKSKEIAYGDILQNKETGSLYIYYGRPHIYGFSYKGYSKLPLLPSSSKKTYIIQKLGIMERYDISSNIDFDFDIVQNMDVIPLTPSQLYDELLRQNTDLIYVGDKPTKKENIKIEYVSLTKDQFMEGKGNLGKDFFVIEKNNQKYIIENFVATFKNAFPYSYREDIRTFKELSFYHKTKDEIKALNFRCFLFKNNNFVNPVCTELYTTLSHKDEDLKFYNLKFTF